MLNDYDDFNQTYSPSSVLSVFGTVWLILFVLMIAVAFAEPARSQESWDSVTDYRTIVCKAKLPTRERVELAKTTVLWKIKQSVMFVPRYIRFVTVSDCGLRESAYIAWNADYLNAREKGYFELWCW